MCANDGLTSSLRCASYGNSKLNDIGRAHNIIVVECNPFRENCSILHTRSAPVVSIISGVQRRKIGQKKKLATPSAVQQPFWRRLIMTANHTSARYTPIFSRNPINSSERACIRRVIQPGVVHKSTRDSAVQPTRRYSWRTQWITCTHFNKSKTDPVKQKYRDFSTRAAAWWCLCMYDLADFSPTSLWTIKWWARAIRARGTSS